MESMPTTKSIDATPRSSAASAVIRVEDAHKYYELGETRVHALRASASKLTVVSFWRSWARAAVANRPS